MEFIGDSISAGACNEDGAEDQWENRNTHNSELSYAALTASAFHADYRNISVSGMGVVEGWVKPHLGQIWDRLYPSVDSPPSDLKEWTPDIIFVEIGDNDDSYTQRHNEVFPLLFTEKLTEVVRSIRKARPQAQIVLVRGGMKGGFESAPLKASWEAAAAELEAHDPAHPPLFHPALVGDAPARRGRPGDGGRAGRVAKEPGLHAAVRYLTGTRGEDLRTMTWVTWALLSALFAGITAVLAKVGVEHVDPNLATAIRTTVILFHHVVHRLHRRSRRAQSRCRERGPFSSSCLRESRRACRGSCYFRALQLGEASRVAPIDKLSVVFAIILAGGIFLRERLTWQHAVGVDPHRRRFARHRMVNLPSRSAEQAASPVVGGMQPGAGLVLRLVISNHSPEKGA